MEVFLFYALFSFFKSLPYDNPALLDILKVVVGSTLWIGGLVGYMYLRERRLKIARINK
jgi:membrane associated rhomboid family serine protease